MTNEKSRVILVLVVIAMVVLIPMVPVLAVQEMTLERAAYIYNVCTGRFLVDDMSVSGYCTGIMLCLQYTIAAECYEDLENGEISDMS
jgi:inner membrane protein involved in colicin E2 resistance